MNTIDALKLFKKNIEERLEKKTGWGKNDFKEQVNEAYMDTMEMLIVTKEFKENFIK